MSRTAAREQALKLLYQSDVLSQSAEEVLESYAAYPPQDDEEPIPHLGEQDDAFMRSLIVGFWENREEIDQMIQRNTKDWKLSRLSKVLLAILRMAVYEMRYCSDIPPLVSINEAVELAKKYDEEGTGAFVNGILGGVLRELPKEE